ncbi:cytochrome P450 [Hysterangium stoloniferum]|nr:cytochrome P450 [Hysterangium stoloniferum]
MNFTSPPVTISPLFPLVFPADKPLLNFSCFGLALLVIFILYSITWSRKSAYDSIPAIGGSDLLSSYRSAMDVIPHGKDMVQAGYEKYKSRMFRVPQMARWDIILSGRKYIEELARAPDDVLSFRAAVQEDIFAKHLLGPTILTNPYHFELIRVNLTRNMGSLFADMKEEMVLACEDNIPVTDGWTKIPAYPAITQIVTRASNRIFVGAPLCRNPEYVNISIKYTLDVAMGRETLSRVPEFLRGIAGKLLTNVPKAIDIAQKHLGPVIAERQKNIDEHGFEYPDKPNDFLSWIMDVAQGQERTPRKLTNRILALNFAAIHTTSLSFMHVLYHLAAEPKYLAPLREEVEAVLEEYGWSKVAMTKLNRLDSFLKESQRINGLTVTSLTRKALRDYTFADGTFVPKGTYIAAAATSTHTDDEIYVNADVFDGFRFSDIREKERQGITNQYISTNPDYIAFGHGKHACPGRFFAANELKAMLAHLVLNYDIKMENEGVRPPNIWAGMNCIPDSSICVMFRRRQD